MSYVLLTDDCLNDLAQMEQLVAGCQGLESRSVQNYDEALAAVADRIPDLVVLDPNLPNGESIRLIESLRKEHPGVAMIIVSSVGEEEASIQALQAGAASYVPKQLLDEVFVQTLMEVMGLLDQQRCHSRMLSLMTQWNCSFVLENDRSLVAPVVAYLQDHAIQLGVCGDSDSTRLGIALDEALVNALYHGNLELNSELREQDLSAFEILAVRRAEETPYRDRRILVTAAMSPGCAEITIEDQGPGFDPASLPDPTDPANLDRVTGRGVLLMRTFMDEVEFSERGNRVTMRKRNKSAD